MSKNFKTAINLEKNELQNAVIQNLSSAPGSPVKGQKYYDTNVDIEFYFNGSSWVPCSYSLTINNNGDQRILTSNGSVSSIDAETDLTFNGTYLHIGSLIRAGNGKIGINIGQNNPNAHIDMVGSIWMSAASSIELAADRTVANRKWKIYRDYTTHRFNIAHTDSSSNITEVIGIDHSSKAIRFNNVYTFPTEIGSVDQVLKVPASGDTLEWGAAGGMVSHGNEFHSVAFLTENQQINLTGDVTGAGGTVINCTIAADSIKGSMLNNNVISGQVELSSGLMSTDELMVSDNGIIKRMDVSVLRNYMETNLPRITLIKPTSDHSASGSVVTLAAGPGGMSFGDAGYVDASGDIVRGDASNPSTSGVTFMCLETSIAPDTNGRFLRRGFVRDDTWNWIPGGMIYLSISGTSGNTLTQSIPSGSLEVVQIIGKALTANIIDFDPCLAMVELIEFLGGEKIQGSNISQFMRTPPDLVAKWIQANPRATRSLLSVK